jgi:hypothetical protein
MVGTRRWKPFRYLFKLFRSQKKNNPPLGLFHDVGDKVIPGMLYLQSLPFKRTSLFLGTHSGSALVPSLSKTVQQTSPAFYLQLEYNLAVDIPTRWISLSITQHHWRASHSTRRSLCAVIVLESSLPICKIILNFFDQPRDEHYFLKHPFLFGRLISCSFATKPGARDLETLEPIRRLSS